MTAYATTSVPGWAITGSSRAPAQPDATARSWIHVAIGVDGAATLRNWGAELDGVAATRISGVTAEDVRAGVAEAISQARVGVRVAIAGPSGDCLVVRAQLLSAGLEEDELTILATSAGPIEVYCPHCRQVTRAAVGIGAVTTCAICGLGLQVYYHVSRLTGRYLGFQADAETLPEGFAP
ncbi:dimethylamine monooxygenase subunit DmmA family protein [Nocardia africana]|uniref:Dimethylamine monooxygenase subunit DmmA family protein n=1 Tax=Nocardia africana TaxID=134964 RepID=A0ABW6NED8_9NOCA